MLVYFQTHPLGGLESWRGFQSLCLSFRKSEDPRFPLFMIPALTKGGGPWRPWPVASKTGVGSSMGAPNPCLEHKICPWILIRAKMVGKNVWLHVGANPATDQTQLARASLQVGNIQAANILCAEYGHGLMARLRIGRGRKIHSRLCHMVQRLLGLGIDKWV